MNSNRSNVGTLVGGAILIMFGSLSIAGQLFGGRFLDWVWPLFIVALGSLFFVAMFAVGRNVSGLAIPGSIIAGIGLVLLVQNATRHWESMAYFWTFIVFFVGAGIFIMGWYGENEGQKNSGKKVMRVGFILLIIFGGLFEAIFSGFDNLVFPILLILLGGYLVLVRSGLLSRTRGSELEVPPSVSK